MAGAAGSLWPLLRTLVACGVCFSCLCKSKCCQLMPWRGWEAREPAGRRQGASGWPATHPPPAALCTRPRAPARTHDPPANPPPHTHTPTSRHSGSHIHVLRSAAPCNNAVTRWKGSCLSLHTPAPRSPTGARALTLQLTAAGSCCTAASHAPPRCPPGRSPGGRSACAAG